MPSILTIELTGKVSPFTVTIIFNCLFIDIIKPAVSGNLEEFFTNSYEFSKKDFANLAEEEEFFEKKKDNNILKIILLIIAIIIFAAAIFSFI